MISQTLNIKPLSVNECWQGKRFKTKKYLSYEKVIGYLLKNGSLQSGNLELIYKFGVSSKLADIDNPVKPFQDILSKYYGFNDNLIVKITIEKILVKKNEEYIYFEIKNI